MSRGSRWAGLAICLFAAWNARSLLFAWQFSPFDRLGWVAALIWLGPLAWAGWRRRPVPAFFLAGLLCSAAGSMAELNLLTYVGLALAAGGFLLSERWAWPWLISAVSWMPIFGWLASSMGPLAANAARLLLALAGTLLCFRRPLV